MIPGRSLKLTAFCFIFLIDSILLRNLTSIVSQNELHKPSQPTGHDNVLDTQELAKTTKEMAEEANMEKCAEEINDKCSLLHR